MAASDYAEKDASMLSSVGNSQTGEHTFTRGWKAEASERKAIIEAELRIIAAVTDPLTDRGKSKHEGVYDVISSGWSNEYSGFVQTLKKRVPYSVGPIVTADNIYETNTEKTFINQEPPAHSNTWMGAFVAGVTRTISAAADAMKKWRYGVQESTSKYVVTHIAIQQRAAGGTDHHIICRNQRGASPSYAVTASDGFTLPVLVSDDGMMYDFAGAPTLNPDGTWNWYIIYKQDNLAISAGETRSLIRVRRTEKAEFKTTGSDAGYKFWRTYWYFTVIAYKAFSNKEAAWFYTSGVSYSPSIPTYAGSGIWIGKQEIEGALPQTAWGERAD